MLRVLVLFSLSAFLSAPLADSACPNGTQPLSPFLFADEILLKLKMELDLLSSSNEVLRLRMEAMGLRLEQQTQVLGMISSKLGISSESNTTSAGSAGGSSCPLSPQYPSSCDEVTIGNNQQNGIRAIQVPIFSAAPFLVFCNANQQGGGWTLIQRRVDGSIDFYLDWAAYKAGFGNLEGNFFLGLDKIHALTTAAPQELLIIMTDFENVTKYAKYDAFAIGDEPESYPLKVLGAYTGDAGDSLTYHQGMKFSTKDRQNDINPSSCAVAFKGGWWYKNCHESNLNGLYLNGPYPTDQYAQGIDWNIWHGHYYSLKYTRMMIRTKRS